MKKKFDFKKTSKTEKEGGVKVRGKFKGFSKKKKAIIILIVALVLVLAIAASIFAFGEKKGKTVINTVKASRGTIQLTISGTGMIEANDQYNVMALVNGEILQAPFEEGDEVSEGDLLYVIDSKNIENNIERSKLSLERTQNSYNQTMEQLDNLTVEAPISGTITALYIEEGDDVGSNTKIAEITDTSKMVLKVPFIAEHIGTLSTGQSASVTLQNTNDVIQGIVTRVTTGTYVNPFGVIVRDVEIVVDNPGAIKEGDIATAIVGDAACNDSGTFKNYGYEVISAKVSGEVVYLPFVQGDSITEGTLLAKIESDTVEQNASSSALSLREAELSLENVYNQLEDYNITSPISGTVIEKTSKAGDTLDSSSRSVAMAVIADMSKILFTMSIDELDITKVKEGQEVIVTADAFEDKVFSGYVEKVSTIGTSQGGVTTYPITVVVNEPEGLIPGMNVSATVIIEKKENVIRVPVSAVRRGNIVAVKGEVKQQEEPKEEQTKRPQRPDGEFPQRPEGDSSQKSPDGAQNKPQGEFPQRPENNSQQRPQGNGQQRPQGEIPQRPQGSQQGENQNAQRGGNANGNALAIGGNIPDGFTAVRVKTGINDENFIEIVSGISEGDEVWIPQSSAASSTPRNQQMPGGMGGFGGMGGMSGGRMPSGMGGGMRR